MGAPGSKRACYSIDHRERHGIRQHHQELHHWEARQGIGRDAVVSFAEGLLANGSVTLDTLLIAVWRGVLEKSIVDRITIYQTGYPQFFETYDKTCDKC